MSIPDQADRDFARLDLGANAVVEAGAGTGKTTLLTDRLLFQLLAGKKATPVTRLVALTFTDKAAAEIKVRLADKLSDVAAGRAEKLVAEAQKKFGVEPAQAQDLARQALEDLDKAQIGTIHSFAAHVLRLFPVEAGVDPGFTVDAEGKFFDELFESRWAAHLDEELGEKPPRAEAWLEVLRLVPLSDLTELARELCGEKLDLDSVGKADLDAAARLSALVDELEKVRDSQPKPRGNSKIVERINELCERLKDLAACAKMVTPVLPERLMKVKLAESKWPKDWDPALEDVYDRARAAATVTDAEREAVTRRACALVLPFARKFRRAFTRRGFISFDGLLRKARDLVRDQIPAREELKRQYAALFIDEFQDTDPLQGEFLMLLAEAPGRSAKDWETAKLGAGRLFVVGDPKQSIYRFRGADIAAYQSFTKKVLTDRSARACDLKANFRSPDALLGPVNAVFETLMLPLDGLQAPYKPLVAGKPGEKTTAVEITRVRGDANAETARGVEARVIAAWIMENCGDGKRRYGDVAILARTAKPFAAIIAALREAGVPYAVETEKGFYGSPEVLDLLNLLRALDDPADRVAIAGLLRSPLALLPDGELLELAKAQKLDYARKTGVARVDALYGQLASLRARVGRLPLGELASAALRETNLLELCAKAYSGAQTVANLSKFARLAAAASDERGLTLKEFVGELLAELADPKGEGESPLADEHLDAVRLLTIHKSKGLEFPVVILANASGKSATGKKLKSSLDWASGRAAVRLETSGAASAAMAWLEPREKERQKHELVRLLYVALTRAKARLLIVGSEKGDSGALSTLLGNAGAWPLPDVERRELTLGVWKIPVHDVDASKPPLLSTISREEGKREAIDVEALAQRWKKRLAARETARGSSWFASPTSLMHEADKARPLEEGARRSPLGALVGTLCHKVLETADLEKPPRGKTLAAAVARARAALGETTPEDAAAAARQAEKALEEFFGSDAAKELAGLEILGREVPFAFAQDGVVVRGALDLLARDKTGRLLVIDYKTNQGGEIQRGALEKRYEPQKRLYTKAVGENADFKLVFI